MMAESVKKGTLSLNYKEQVATIQANGNQPEEWQEYIQFLKEKIDLLEDSKKTKMMAFMYYTALKSIGESCKSHVRAQLLIDYADLKCTQLQDPNDAEKILSVGRRTLRHHSAVHIACAEFEMRKGNKSKAKRYLEQAQAVGSTPAVDINIALERLNAGHVTLTGGESLTMVVGRPGRGALADRSNTDHVGLSSNSSPDSGRESSGECTSSQLSGYMERSRELIRQHLPGKQPCYNTQELQEGIDFVTSHISQSQAAAHPSASQQHQQQSLSRGAADTEMKPDPPSHQARPLQGLSEIPEMPVLLSQSSRGRHGSGLRSTVSTSCLPGTERERMPFSWETPVAKSRLFNQQQQHNNHDRPDWSARKGSAPDMNSLSCVKESARKRAAVGLPRRVPKKLNEDESGNTGGEEIGEITVSAFQRLVPLPRPATVDISAIRNMAIDEKSEEESLSPEDVSIPTSVPTDAKQLCSRPAQSHGSPQAENIKINNATYTSPNAHVPPSTPLPPNPVPPHAAPTPAPTPRPPVSVPVPAMQTPTTTTTQPAPPQQKVKVVNGKPYTVMRLVGRGGSAKVFQVLDMQKCAIKALKVVDLSGVNANILEGYMNEIGLLQKLGGCDRVIDIFDYEYCEASRKLLMLLECGETDLASFISQNAKRKDHLHDITVNYFWGQMVNAVHAMHAQGVIHSDLKPANFILVSGQVKLIDFGIAKALQTDKTSVLKEAMVGTPSYMSPEALMANNSSSSSVDTGGDKPRYKVGVRSDVWSLGCILYQMVYGRTPFQHLRSKLEAIINPEHVIEFPDLQDATLTDVLHKCLTRSVQDRPTTAQLLGHPYLNRSEKMK